MGEVGDAASARLGDYADVEDLHEKPEADKERCRDQSNPEKDDEEDEGANAVAGKGDEECSHHGGDGSAGAERRDAGERIAEDLRGHGDNSADEIEDGEAKAPHGVFDLATEGP